jgi:hypothetical protein
MAKKNSNTTKSASKKEKVTKTTKPTKTTKSTKSTGAKAKKTVEKKKRRTYNDSLVLFYGGALKPSRICVSTVSGSVKKEDVLEHVYDEFSCYYGNTLTGRFIKCENVEDALESFKEACSEWLVDGSDFVYKMCATDAINQAKKATGTDTACQFKLETYEAEEKDSSEDEEEGEEEDDSNSDEEEEEEDEEEEEEEEEVEPIPKRKNTSKGKGKSKGKTAKTH